MSATKLLAGPADFPGRKLVGINLSGIAWYSSNRPFTNAAKTASPWFSPGNPAAKLPCDDRGYPLQAPGEKAECFVLNGDYPSGHYILTWEGGGSVELNAAEDTTVREISRTERRRVYDVKLGAQPARIVLEAGISRPERIALWIPGYGPDSPEFAAEWVESLEPFGPSSTV